MKRLSIPTALSLAIAAALLAAGCATTPAPRDEFTRIADAADALAVSGKVLVMPAERLHALLTDADPANDPFLISVCAPGDYAKAHIKGSINIPREPSGSRRISPSCRRRTSRSSPTAIRAPARSDR